MKIITAQEKEKAAYFSSPLKCSISFDSFWHLVFESDSCFLKPKIYNGILSEKCIKQLCTIYVNVVWEPKSLGTISTM